MSLRLEEDTTDDILYFARTASIPDLLTLLDSLATSLDATSLAIVSQAKDASTGNTALHYAAANGHSDVILAILATSEAEPAVANQDSKSSVQSPTRSIVTQPNDAGNLPLHYAALNGHLATCKILLLALMPSFSAVTLQTSDTGLLPPAADADETLRDALKGLDEQHKKDILAVLETKNSAGRDAAGEAESAAKDEIVGWLLGVMDRLEGGEGDGELDGEEKLSMGDTTGDDVAEDVADMKVED